MGGKSIEPRALDSAVTEQPDTETSLVRRTGDFPQLSRPPQVPSEVRPKPQVHQPAREEAETDAEHVSATRSLPPAAARFGRYDVLGRVAVGGMAEIFVARESSLGGGVRHLALKVLKRRAQDDQEGAYFEELFQREGRTAMLLAHPNIGHVYEFGKVEDRFFIAMEWIPGRSLSEVLARLQRGGQAGPPLVAAAILAQVADALHYAHNLRDPRNRPLQVVHRDVNPQNIMLRYDGSVKLLDFGVAHVDEPEQDSRAGTLKGKLSYMAPEQLQRQQLDCRADVFALGVCLYEALAGARLYKRASAGATLEAVVREPVPSLRQVRPEVPAELEQVAQRALQKDPSERYQTAAALQEALEAFLAHSGEIVNRRRLAEFMAGLFPEAGEGLLPNLDASAEVLGHLAPRAMETGAFSAVPASSPASARARPTIAVWALLCLAAIGIAAALAWGGRPAGARQEGLAGAGAATAGQHAGAGAASTQQAPRSAPSPEPETPPGQVAPEPVAAPSTASHPATPTAAPAQRRRAPRGKSKHRKTPAFVTDPGF